MSGSTALTNAAGFELDGARVRLVDRLSRIGAAPDATRTMTGSRADRRSAASSPGAVARPRAVFVRLARSDQGRLRLSGSHALK